jgi:hypothetical protein
VVDAMLNVHRASGPGLLEPSDQGRHYTDGQRVMSEFVAFLGALRVFAVKLSRNID